MRRPIVLDTRPNACFGCGPDNPAGLGLSFHETDDGAETDVVVPAHLGGAPGVVHGGIQATLLDEVMCVTAYAKAGTRVVTGELTVRYLLPAPTGRKLCVRGRIAGRKGRSLLIEGAIEDAATGELLARAHGRFFPNLAQPAANDGVAASASRDAVRGASGGSACTRRVASED
ncbi:MAG TPA: PaaI family thioesterase [Candidatus Binatia bacterium]|nr:PaaI family thioesterase [Candidatus Binatia bacterium]